MFTTSVYFNNFDLATLPGVKVYNYNIKELPTRNLTTAKLARANRSLLTSAEYATKDIFVYCFVGGGDHSTLQDNYDILKARVQDIEAVIRLRQGTTDVEYVGTLNSVSQESLGPTLKVTLGFRCSNPLGQDYASTELFSPITITNSTISRQLTIGGSSIAEPRFTLTINSVTGGTGGSISLLNAATGKGIRLTRDYVAGDIISIASDTMELVVNATEVDFSGQFPTFLPGSRTLQYIDDFTTRNVTLSGLYYKRYS